MNRLEQSFTLSALMILWSLALFVEAFSLTPALPCGSFRAHSYSTLQKLHSIATGPQGKPGSSREEDIALTLQLIREHDEPSTTFTEEQFVQQMEESAQVQPIEMDVSVPYDAAARLAYDNSGKEMMFDDFQTKYLAEAVALVKSRQKKPVENTAPSPPSPQAAAPAAPAAPATPPVSSAKEEHSSTKSTNDDIHSGTVKWFDSKKGFGFITGPGGEDIFVHQTELQAEGFRSVENGAAVEFQIDTAGDGKKKAVRVTGPNGEPLKRGFAYKKRQD